MTELADIIATAKSLHASTIWTQSGLSAAGVKDSKGYWLSEDELKSARNVVEAAGLTFVTQPYIVEVAREIRSST